MPFQLFIFASACLFACLSLAEPANLRLHGREDTSWSARLQSIREAQTRLHIEVFYLENDLIGQELIQEIIQAKANNPQLEVRLLLDAWGSETFPKELACALNEKGVFVKIFSPSQRFKKLTQERNHRKIWVADNTGIIGGRNISEEHFYTEGSSVEVPYTDWDVELQGPIVEKLETSFHQAWTSGLSNFGYCADPLSAAKLNEYRSNLKQMLSSRPRNIGLVKMPRWHNGNVEWNADNPGNRKVSRPVSEKAVSLVRDAKIQILTETFVFIPVSNLAKELDKAQKRGVNFEFLMNGPMDGYWMGELASCLTLPEMNYWLKRNANIVMTDPIARTHAKAMLVDNQILAIGSFNWDARSYIWNAETLLVIRDSPEIVSEFKSFHQERMSAGHKIKSLEDVFKASGMSRQQELKCRSQSLLRSILGRFF